MGPKDLVDKITGAGVNVKSDCSNIGSLPVLTFTIDGKDYPLTAEEYVIKIT